jgi:predicted membrane metal-binding protein
MSDLSSPVPTGRLGRLTRLLAALRSFAWTQGSQPSTWRGLVMLLSACGVALRPEVSAAIIAVGMALSGLIGVLAPDQAELGRSPDVPAGE